MSVGVEGEGGKEEKERELEASEEETLKTLFSLEFLSPGNSRLGTEGTGTWQRASWQQALGNL
jgi:hypothetical protein